MEKLVYPFSFEEENRKRLTFSDATKVRLNPDTNQVELAAQARDPVTDALLYPTTTNLWVKTWLATPQAVRTWLSFFAETTEPTGTAIKFKLNDGTTDRFWNGTTWATAGASNWNTMVEVNAHISTFPTTSRSLAVIVNLTTTDPLVTPAVSAIDLLMDCEIDYLYSLIADSVGKTLKENLRVSIAYAVDAPGGLRVSLGDLETLFSIVSVDGVYDHKADPLHRTNLLDSYDLVAKDVLLTTAAVRGTPLWLTFTAEPEVYVNWGSQDYVEVERIPAVVIDSIDISIVQNVARQEAKNVATGTAVVRRLPLRLDVRFAVVLLAEKNRTLLAMMDKALKYTASNPVLKWRDIDHDVSVRSPAAALAFVPRPNLSDKHESSFNLQLDNVYLWLRPEESLPLIERVNLVLSRSNQGGPLWAGADG